MFFSIVARYATILRFGSDFNGFESRCRARPDVLACAAKGAARHLAQSCPVTGALILDV
jgi:hypothetical protein